jgi:hypothetical protein
MVKDEGLLPGKASDRGVTAADNRLLWKPYCGSLEPAHLGGTCRARLSDNWNSAYIRFNRWCKGGVWHRVMMRLGTDWDMEALMMDSTVVRTHQHAAGAPKNGVPSAGSVSGWAEYQDPCCRGCLGQSAALLLSGGEVADITHAQALLAGFHAKAVLADKGMTRMSC